MQPALLSDNAKQPANKQISDTLLFDRSATGKARLAGQPGLLFVHHPLPFARLVDRTLIQKIRANDTRKGA
jgi:hypothetical protein